MKNIGKYKGFFASSQRARHVRRSWLAWSFAAFAGLQATAQAHSANCDPVYDSNTYYPPLSRASETTVDGQTGVFIYLLEDRALVEHDDACFYEVNEIVLEVDFGDLEESTLVFELPEHADGATVYVTDGGALVETLELREGSFTYVLTEGAELGFEIATPGMPAPTVPVLVTKPTTDDPEPV